MDQLIGNVSDDNAPGAGALPGGADRAKRIAPL
jgi:hypothetical protein